MKKLNLLLLVAAIALAQACGGSKDSKAKADSANASSDTSTTSMPPDSAAKSAAHIEVPKDDAAFAVAAMAGSVNEVDLGKLAQQKSNDSKVKDFGAMMVTDHTKANTELLALGQSLRIALPVVADRDGQKLLHELSQKSGADFDKAYVTAMVNDHKEDIEAFEKEGKYGTSTDLKAFANKTLPVLNKHLAAIQQIQSSMK